ncbi:MAG: DegT/DnrJ/EryC1/StrS aminotransferase family protein [Hyphomicrobiales bacterium]|nr:DegT/DnrJ/EryC1/StrS aminotransferase family protein [Hyphomicrobiales bacterium]
MATAVLSNAAAPAPGQTWPVYAEDEIAAVVDVLRSGKVNQWTGDRVKAFQDQFTARMQGGKGLALANGTLALELALRAFGVGPGDEVIVTPRSFVASASCVLLVGATPVFADVERDSGNISARTIAPCMTARTRAIIPVHLAGWPCDMPAIMELARKRNCIVIEDCAQSHGAEIGGKPAGAYGDAAAYSFCQDKIMTTGGEGGFVTFKDENLWEKAWSFKDHGKNWREVNSPPKAPGFRWLHDDLGTNWRMTEMQAAIGLKQLEKLDAWRAARKRNAEIYRHALSGLAAIRAPEPDAKDKHAYYKYYVYLDPQALKQNMTRDAVLALLAERGLRAFSGSCSEIYREKVFAHLPTPECAHARELGQTSLMFEVHPTLDPAHVERMAKGVADVVRSAQA